MTFIIRAHGRKIPLESLLSNHFLWNRETYSADLVYQYGVKRDRDTFELKEIKYILQFFLQILYFFQYCLWNNKCFAW